MGHGLEAVVRFGWRGCGGDGGGGDEGRDDEFGDQGFVALYFHVLD